MALKIKTGVSKLPNTAEAALEVAAKIQQKDIKLVVFFSTAAHDGNALTQALAKALPGIRLAGCSTAGEITPKGFLTKSLTAMSFASPDFQASVTLATGLAQDARQAAATALKKAFAELGETPQNFNPQEHVAMIMPDGLAGKEELFIFGLNEVAPSLSVVGGSAGDDLQFKKTWVSNGQQALSDAAVLVLIKTSHPWALFKTSSYVPTGKTMTITKADPEKRVVYEFDRKPAAEAYAQAINKPQDKIQDVFMNHPVAVELPDGFYNRSPQQVIESNAIKFYCNIAEGTTVSVMKPGDVNKNLAKTMRAIKKHFHGKIAGFVAFNCILRFLEAEKKKISPALFKTLKIAPVIGFDTYGEQLNTLHINQTITLLVFGS